MKNAMKKLMAFALVAVMLIGALPFAASADTVPLIVFKGDTQVYGNQPDHYATAGESLTVDQLAANLHIETWEVHAIEVNGTGKGWGTTIEFVAGTPVTVKYILKENAAAPKNISFSVKYGNGVTRSFTVKEGDILGESILPANAATIKARLGWEFSHYVVSNRDSYPTAAWAAYADLDQMVIEGVWNQIGCDECGLAFGTGHTEGCSQNPNKETEAPKDETPDAPVVTEKAILNIYVNNKLVTKNFSDHSTEGTIGETVSVANCIAFAGATNVETVALNGAPIAQNATFKLAAGTNNISIATASSSTGNNGGSSTTTPDTDDEDTTPTGRKATAYIYVGDNDLYSTKYEYDYAFSIAQIVDKFDDNDTDKHYAFNYYLKNGSSKFYYEENDVVQLGETVHVRLKVTESKLNHNKVYLQIFLNNNFDTPAKTLNVTTMATEDGLNLYGNVEDLILDNFTAKNSKGIKMDGMYESEGSWVSDFLEDDKVSKRTADQIIEAKEETFVVYNIMVTNAKTSSSGTADDTNPKTGDQIMIPVAIMAVSASVLAAVAFYLNKKRVY